MLNRSTKHIQSGRSMIEMLGVLAIVGVLSAGGIAGYSMAMQSYKGTQLTEKIGLIATRVRTVYKGDYTGISNANMINSGKLSSNDLQNPFGGDLTVRVASTSTAHFVVETTANIPADTCVDLLETNWGDSGVFHAVFINDTLVDGPYPVATATAISSCKTGNKKISFTFK